MESRANSTTGHHKSGKLSSRRARKRHRSSASTLLKLSKSGNGWRVAKAQPALADEASAFTAVSTPLSTQTSPATPKKPESDALAERATAHTSPERTTMVVTPSVHLAFDNTMLVEEPVVVASPPSPLVIPDKASTSNRQSVLADTCAVAPHPRASFATTTDANDVHHRTATGHQVRQRTLDATFAAANVHVPTMPQKLQRKLSCVKLVLSALPNVLLAVLTLALVYMAVIVLTPDSSPPEVCRSHSCIEYSGRLRRTVNLLVSPCVSLARFVCAGWTAHDELGVRPGVVEAALDRLSRLAFTVLAPPSGPQSTVQRAAIFFRSCEAVLRGDRDELEAVKQALVEAGVTWPLLPRDTPDVLHTLLFTTVRLGWPAVLRVHIVGSGDDEQQSGHKEPTILLTPSREFVMLALKHVSLLEAPASRNAYFALLRDSFASGTGEAVTFAATQDVEDNFLFLATVLSASTSRCVQLDGSMVFAGKLAPESRWRSALSAYGLPLHKGRRLLVQTEHVDFLRAFLDAWESNGEVDTHLFISWFTIQLAALFARRSLILSFYGSHRGTQVMHRAFCLARTYLLYGSAAFASYSADTLFATLRRNAEALAVAVRQTLRTSIAQWPHRNDSTTIAVDWNSTDIMFKVVKSAMREASGGSADHDEPQYPNMGNSLVSNWRNAIAAGLATASSSRAPVLKAIEALAFHAQLEDDFVLMPYAFSFPLYDVDALQAINYGGLGGQVAQALGELLLKAYRDSNFPASDSIRRMTRCMKMKNATTAHAEALALQVLSFNVLYDAYRAAGEARDRRLVGFEKLTPAQLFFVAACYARCPGGAHVSYSPALPLTDAPYEPDCDDLLKRTAQFANAFECDQQDSTKAGDECELSPV